MQFFKFSIFLLNIYKNLYFLFEYLLKCNINLLNFQLFYFNIYYDLIFNLLNFQFFYLNIC